MNNEDEERIKAAFTKVLTDFTLSEGWKTTNQSEIWTASKPVSKNMTHLVSLIVYEDSKFSIISNMEADGKNMQLEVSGGSEWSELLPLNGKLEELLQIAKDKKEELIELLIAEPGKEIDW